MLAIATSAFAQERVTLADGTVMQGELVEKVPGDHITIKLATGEIRTIQWGALAPVQQQQQPMMQGPPQPPQGPVARVQLDADKPGVTLLKVTGFGIVHAYSAYGSATGGFMNFEPVCVAPCQANAEQNAMYRVAGDGVTPTSTFGLPAPAPDGAVHRHVAAGSAGARVAGIWLTVGGITLLVTGGMLAGLGAALNDPTSPYSDMSGLIVSGLVTAGVGVVLTAIGIPLIVSSGTNVVNEQGVPIA